MEVLIDSKLANLFAKLHEYLEHSQLPPNKFFLVEQDGHLEIPDLKYPETICLQKKLWKKCHENKIDFFYVCILHSWYHHLRQGLTKYDDVKTLKQLFSEAVMAQIDVCADTQLFKFLHTMCWSFEDYCKKILFEGLSVFPRADLTNDKICRFLGSLWSIWHYSCTEKTRLHLPATAYNLAKFPEELEIVILLTQDGVNRVEQKIIEGGLFLPLLKVFSLELDPTPDEYYQILLKVAKCLD